MLTETSVEDFKQMMQVAQRLRAAWLQQGHGADGIFDKLDADANGLLTTDELVAGLKSLGGAGEVSEQDLRKLATSADVTGDGLVDYREFMEGLLWMEEDDMAANA